MWRPKNKLLPAALSLAALLGCSNPFGPSRSQASGRYELVGMWERPLPIRFGWFVVTGGSLELAESATAVWSLELENPHGESEGISTSGTYEAHDTETAREIRATFIELRLADPEGYPKSSWLSGYLVGNRLTLEGLGAFWQFTQVTSRDQHARALQSAPTTTRCVPLMALMSRGRRDHSLLQHA